MNSRSSPLPSHRKKMAKDDVSYLFDSAKFRDKSTPAAQIVATATNMKGWERPIDPSFSDRVTRRIHHSITTKESSLSDLGTAFDKVFLAIKTDPGEHDNVIGPAPKSIIPVSFHIKTLEPRLGDDALSLRGGENDDTDYQNVFIPLSRDFPSTKPTGRWEVLQLARVFDELGLNQTITSSHSHGNKKNKDDSYYSESFHGADRSEMQALLSSRWTSLYIVLTEFTRQSWVYCIERGILLWCITHSLDNLFKTAVDRCRVLEDLCFHKETQISEKNDLIAELEREKEYISQLLEKVTIEIEGHKSKRDFFYSRMQESEEREQLNKAETIEAKKRSEQLVTEVNRLKTNIAENKIQQVHLEELIRTHKEENILMEFRLEHCTCEGNNKKPPLITRHTGTQTDAIPYEYLPQDTNTNELDREEPVEPEKSTEESQEEDSEESLTMDLPDTLGVHFSANNGSCQVRMFRSTYERPDSPDLNYLDPEILSVTRDSAKETSFSQSSTKEQFATSTGENDQELGGNTTSSNDYAYGMKEVKSTDSFEKEKEFVWCHILVVDRSNPSDIHFENIFAAPETQLEILRIINEIKPKYFVPGMDRLLIGTFQLFSMKTKFFVQRLLMELHFMPDFLHAFLVRNMESGIDRTKRFYSFIAAQDHPLAEGWTSSMKVVLLKDPDTEMYAPVNLAVMEPLNIKSLCRRLALKRDRCELEFRVRAFMSSRRDRLYRTFMVFSCMKGVGYQEYAKIEPSDFMNFVQSIRYESILKNKHTSSDKSRRKSTFSNVVYGVFNAADSTRDADSEASGRFDNRLEFHEFQTTIVFLAFEGFLKGDYSRLSSYSLVQACRRVIESHVERYTKAADRFLCYAVEALIKPPVQKVISNRSRVLEKIFSTEAGNGPRMTVLQFIEVVKRFRDVSGQDFTTSNKAAAMAAMNSILEGSNKIPDTPTLNRSQFLLALCQVVIGGKGTQYSELKNNPELVQWHMEEMLNQLDMIQWGTIKE